MTAEPAVHSDGANDTAIAIRNGLKLAVSLISTWGVAIGMRMFVPRHLGPTLFGSLNFADAFTGTGFVFLGLGMDVYIHKEIPVRPAHASDFYGGAFVMRVLLSLVIFAGMAAVMSFTNQPVAVRQVVYVYGVAQFFVSANASLSALLHAQGTVNAMSVLAVVTKVIWAVGVVTAIFLRLPLWTLAASFLLGEVIETFALFKIVQSNMGLVFRVDAAATRAMLVMSLPYFVSSLANTGYAKLDISMLEFMAGSKEVGWYGAGAAIAQLALLLIPIIGWVMTPMFSRAAARSRDELFREIRRAMELILVCAIPAALIINLSAEFLIKLLFGDAFAPAVLALRVLATMFVLTYVAIVQSIALTLLERAWTQTNISVAGLAVNATLNALLIRPGLRMFGDGGGGAACATAMMCTEVFVTASMMIAIGGGAFDRRSVVAIVKSVGACVAVVLADRAMRPLGDWRLILDGVLYVALAAGSGALRIGEIVGVLRAALRAKQGNVA